MDGIKGFFGAEEGSVTSTMTEDADFADFATSSLSSIAKAATSLAGAASGDASATGFAAPATGRLPMYDDGHPWYAFWMRTNPEDFMAEYIVLGVIGVIILIHVFGANSNRRMARKWIREHAPLFQREFALVGFGKTLTTSEAVQDAVNKGDIVVSAKDLMREDSSQEFASYATGRLNVSHMNININLIKRSNPLYLFFDWVLSQLFESFPAPEDFVNLTIYPSDGGDSGKTGGQTSKYDGFVWAIVNKMNMSKHRNSRYDLSLTRTIDNPKLPPYLTVMTESGEITDMMLTKEFIAAIEAAGTSFDYLIITDQPFEKPNKLAEFMVKKRIVLQLSLPGRNSTVPTVEHFIRLTDTLVAQAHFRAEVLKKIKHTRDEEKKRFEKLHEEELAETRLTERDEKKKKEREEKLRGMSADEQKKFLEKEREKDNKRLMSKKIRRA